MFIGPWEQGGEWNDSGINGAARWLNKVWDLFTQPTRKNKGPKKNEESERELLRHLHKTIARVGEDIERFKYNTAISSLMQYTNHLTGKQLDESISIDIWKECLDKLLILMAPIVPHLSEELWEMTGNDFSVHQRNWPDYDEQLATDEKITLVVQVNGKVRDKIEAPITIHEDKAKELALSSSKIERQIEDKKVLKVIYVPGRLVNIVVK
jgi:leucyl-tRNA synthetase